MSRSRREVLVLGAGPAGLGVAWKMARGGDLEVTVLERNDRVGGNAGSFELGGMRVDYGSHRLHPACPPEILEDIRSFLGEDLLRRPRHGRIRLGGRWIHFPLKPLDLAFNLPPEFTLGVARDALLKPFRRSSDEHFAGVLRKGLGPTICNRFYFPYAEKIWGLAPEEIDAEQARRRVSAGSLGKAVRKVLAAVPGLRKPDTGTFFYPRGGYGRISEAYHEAALSAGARVELETSAEEVELDDGRVVAVKARGPRGKVRLPARQVLSTIPLPVLVRALRPRAPDQVLEASRRMRYRGMTLIYLVLAAERFTEYDAHYFPALDVPISRVSEPKNYGLAEVENRTVLCAELPLAHEDPLWKASEGALGRLVVDVLESVDLPLESEIVQVRVRRIPQAYPIYDRGYRERFEVLDRFVADIEGLVTFGRQGLFVHDNTHHTLAMAYALADSLDAEGRLDPERWAEHREEFESFVVED